MCLNLGYPFWKMGLLLEGLSRELVTMTQCSFKAPSLVLGASVAIKYYFWRSSPGISPLAPEETSAIGKGRDELECCGKPTLLAAPVPGKEASAWSRHRNAFRRKNSKLKVILRETNSRGKWTDSRRWGSRVKGTGHSRTQHWSCQKTAGTGQSLLSSLSPSFSTPPLPDQKTSAASFSLVIWIPLQESQCSTEQTRKSAKRFGRHPW